MAKTVVGAAGKDSDRRKAPHEKMVLEISFTALNRLAALRPCEERGWGRRHPKRIDFGCLPPKKRQIP